MKFKTQYLYFLHIPKTSGTSLTAALDQLFHPNEIYPYKTPWQIQHWLSDKVEKAQAISTLTLQKYRFIRGHFANSRSFTQRRFVFTVFRRPYLRTLSQLRHIQADPVTNAWFDPAEISPETNYWNLLHQDVIRNYLSDLQTKYLLNKSEKLDNSFDTDFPELAQPLKGPILWQLARALFQMLKLDYFGIQELYPESLVLLSDKIGRNISINQERLMTHGQISEDIVISPEHQAELESLNQSDRILYKIARRIFLLRWCNYLRRVHHLRFTPNSYLNHRSEFVDQLAGIKILEER